MPLHDRCLIADLNVLLVSTVPTHSVLTSSAAPRLQTSAGPWLNPPARYHFDHIHSTKRFIADHQMANLPMRLLALVVACAAVASARPGPAVDCTVSFKATTTSANNVRPGGGPLTGSGSGAMRSAGTPAPLLVLRPTRPQDKGTVTYCWDGNSTNFNVGSKFVAKASERGSGKGGPELRMSAAVANRE